MKREHLINSILSAVFPSGSIPLERAHEVPEILAAANKLAAYMPGDDGQPGPRVRRVKATGRGRKGIDWDAEPLLGQVPDTVLAKQYGVCSETVFYARKSRGIPASTPKYPAVATPSPEAVISIPETTPPPRTDRQRELDAIEQHVKTKGVTKVQASHVEPDSIPANPKGRGGLV